MNKLLENPAVRVISLLITLGIAIFAVIQFRLLEFAANLSPLLVSGVIVFACAYFAFYHRNFREYRIAMGASFFIGVLFFVALVIIFGVERVRLSDETVKDFRVFSIIGLFGGTLTGVLLIWLVKRWGKSVPQYVTMALSVFSFTILYFYLFTSETVSQIVAAFSIGVIIGVLFQFMTIGTTKDLENLLQPKRSKSD